MEMNENYNEGNSDMDEIISRLEALFTEREEYRIELLNEYLKHTGELTVVVDRIKSEILRENPNISHEELIDMASEQIAEIVKSQDMEDKTQNAEER